MYTPFPEEVYKWILYICPQQCLVTIMSVFRIYQNLSRSQNNGKKKLLDFVSSTSQILFLVMKTLISLELLLRGFGR